jgi:hypothetical protein
LTSNPTQPSLPELLTPGRLIVLHVLLGDHHGTPPKVPAQTLGFKVVSLAHPDQYVKTRLAGKVMLSLNIRLGEANPFPALRATDSLPTAPGLHTPDWPFPGFPSADYGSLSNSGPTQPLLRRLTQSSF